MAKTVNSLDGMTMRDLMSDDGIVIDMSDDIGEQAYEPYPYRPNINLTNDEMIRLLNMEEFGEDDGEERVDTAEAMMPWSISFDKIKAKSQDLTNGNGKITKLIKQNGVGEVVPSDSLVIIHYGGYFEHQDEPFDSTFARGRPGRFRLNQGELLWGLEIGIRTMKKHETACFVIHPDFAYGELGCVPLVPPNAEVLFIVNVVDFIDGGSAETLENLSVEERSQFRNVKIRAVALIKTAATSFNRQSTRQAIREYFGGESIDILYIQPNSPVSKSDRYEKSFSRYSRAINLLESAKLDNDEEEDEMKRLLTRAYGNLAVCFNKEDKPRQACKACLNVPHPTAKTHFHHGRALMKMGEYARALEELQLALKNDPKNIRTINEIQLANDHQRKYVEAEKRMWANCLKVRNGEQTVNEYVQVAKEFCASFAKNESILRQPLPEGLTPVEDTHIRQQAAILGLTVIQQIRYGKEITYLAKSAY